MGWAWCATIATNLGAIAAAVYLVAHDHPWIGVLCLLIVRVAETQKAKP